VHDPKVIHDLDTPIAKEALAVLHGNLAPDGALIKPSAASPDLMNHRGRAIVFDNIEELHAQINSEDLEVDKTSVLVLRNCGPHGAPGMPEWGMLPIPKKLLKQGVRDMVRVSDARMSGTSYGTCVLHVTPEAHIGGPLSLVRTGDFIELDVAARRIHLAVDEQELAVRRAAWVAPAARFERGYGAIFLNHIQQANVGCDFDILRGNAPTPEPAV
jgi:dihydroxyacid dehydratase/phosphogluconate dehydratase